MEQPVSVVRSELYAGISERWPEALAGAKVRCIFTMTTRPGQEEDMIDIVLPNGTNYALARYVDVESDAVRVVTHLQLFEAEGWGAKHQGVHVRYFPLGDIETVLTNAFVNAVERFFVPQIVNSEA